MNNVYYEIDIDQHNIISGGVDGRRIRGTLNAEVLQELNPLFDEIKKNARTPKDVLKDIGFKMYSSLLPSETLEGNPISLQQDFAPYYSNALLGKTYLTMVLRIDNDLVQSLPWELLHDGNYFLGPQNNINVIRMPFAIPPNAKDLIPKQIKDKIRILTIVSTPLGKSPLKYAQNEHNKIEEVWKGQASGKFEIHTLSTTLRESERPTLQNIAREIDSFQPNIVHYIGHSVFRDKGVMFLSNPDGSSKEEDEIQFAGIFNAGRLRELALVILNSCDSGTQGGFNGIARRLVERGIPVVVAMQFGIFDYLAPKFASDFYERLIGSEFSVEEAIKHCREMSYIGEGAAAGPDMLEFAAPVLYLASINSTIFQLGNRPKQPGGAAQSFAEELARSIQIYDSRLNHGPNRVSHSEFYYSPDKGNLAAILMAFQANAEEFKLSDYDKTFIEEMLSWIPIELDKLGRPGNNEDFSQAKLNGYYNKVLKFINNFYRKQNMDGGS